MNRLPLPRALDWLVWGGAFVVATIVLLALRGDIDQAHVSLIYLMIILGAGASSGRALALALAILGFLSIDYFFQPPFYEFAVGKRPDWLVLIAFLATALVATQLLVRAQEKADDARRRAEEIDRLAALGAETLSAGRAEDALVAIVRVIRDTIGARRGEIWTFSEDEGKPILAAAAGEGPTIGPGGAPMALVPAEATQPGGAGDGVEELALRTRDRIVGALRLTTSSPLDAAQRRLLVALAYYAALGVERVRLVAEAEHAEALREADRLKDALLVSVSHDLRTPLTAIKAHAHDIADKGDERAAIIESQADRLNRMVGDLLEMSRINLGELPVRAEVNAAEDLVGSAIQEVSGALQGREIRPLIAWTEPVLLGHFDFVHSLRILVNLIENANKYSPAGRPIDITLTRDGEWLSIAVADRGPGVPPHERERIFEPFYRPPRVSADSGGTGLGLAISRALATAQGGTVDYADRPGGGSIFTLRLPAMPDAAPAASASA